MLIARAKADQICACGEIRAAQSHVMDARELPSIRQPCHLASKHVEDRDRHEIRVR